MQKQNIFDLYNEQHKDDVKAADKIPGEVTLEDVDQEPEQKMTPEPEQKMTPEPEQEAGGETE